MGIVTSIKPDGALVQRRRDGTAVTSHGRHDTDTIEIRVMPS